MSKPTALSIGIQRGRLEIKQFIRQRESVVFTMLFPLILLAIFGSVFSKSIASGVTFSQYFVAGMIASGMVNTGFQQLAIMIPVERDFGTLKRLRGTPMPASSYFIGKAILVTLSMVVQVVQEVLVQAVHRELVVLMVQTVQMVLRVQVDTLAHLVIVVTVDIQE